MSKGFSVKVSSIKIQTFLGFTKIIILNKTIMYYRIRTSLYISLIKKKNVSNWNKKIFS